MIGRWNVLILTQPEFVWRNFLRANVSEVILSFNSLQKRNIRDESGTWQESAVEVAAGIRDRRFSCSEVMASVVERIRKLNPKLNAIVVDLADQALAEASAADRKLPTLAEPGRSRCSGHH